MTAPRYVLMQIRAVLASADAETYAAWQKAVGSVPVRNTTAEFERYHQASAALVSFDAWIEVPAEAT